MDLSEALIKHLQLNNNLIKTEDIDANPTNCLVLCQAPEQQTFNYGLLPATSPLISGFAGASNERLQQFGIQHFAVEDSVKDGKRIDPWTFVVVDERSLHDGTVKVYQQDVGCLYDAETGETDDEAEQVERLEGLRCRWHELAWFLSYLEEDSMILTKGVHTPPLTEDDVWIGIGDDEILEPMVEEDK